MNAILLLLVLAQADVDEAKAQFDRGRTALSTGRFAEARDRFRESLELAPRAPTAFNLAIALRGTGEPVEAVSVFEALLAGRYGDLSKNQRTELAQLLEATRQEVAVLELRISGAPSAELRLDGRQIGTLDEGASLRRDVDPGAHVVIATAPRRELAERRIDIPRGGTAALTIELLMTPDASQARLIVEGDTGDLVRIAGVGEGEVTLERAVSPGRYRIEAVGPTGARTTEVDVEAGQTLRVRMEAEQSGITSSPWFWGGVAAVVVGAVVASVAVFGNRTEDPVRDPTYDVVTALRAHEP